METIKDLSDCELLRLLRGGDPSALATLYQRRQRGIYRFALQMSGSTSIAEDITQEVFLVLIHDNSNFDETRGSLNSFLFGVARNRVMKHLEKTPREMSQPSGISARTVECRSPSGGSAAIAWSVVITVGDSITKAGASTFLRSSRGLPSRPTRSA